MKTEQYPNGATHAELALTVLALIESTDSLQLLLPTMGTACHLSGSRLETYGNDIAGEIEQSRLEVNYTLACIGGLKTKLDILGENAVARFTYWHGRDLQLPDQMRWDMEYLVGSQLVKRSATTPLSSLQVIRQRYEEGTFS